MQIIAITQSRKSQQVWLKFDSGYFLPLKVDDIVVLKLQKFTEISLDQLDQIRVSSAKYLLLEYCLRQIATSAKTAKVLNQKLAVYCHKLVQKYDFNLDFLAVLIDGAINKVISDGLLDNQSYIDHLVRKHPKKSIQEINYRLKMSGIDAQLPPDNAVEVNKIKNIILKKAKSLDLSDYKDKNKLVSSLCRKGFPIELIKTAIDETLHVR